MQASSLRATDYSSGVAFSVPSWVLCPALLGGRVWVEVREGMSGGILKVLGVGEERTAIEVEVFCVTRGEGSVALDSEALARFFELLAPLGVNVDVYVSRDALVLTAYFAKTTVELRFPAEPAEYPELKLPEPKFRGSALGVFDETVRLLKGLRGSDSRQVRVKAESGKLTVEPPRRIFYAEGAAERVEVRVLFGDLRAVLEALEAAGLVPETLWLGEHVLGLEASFGCARATGLVHGLQE